MPVTLTIKQVPDRLAQKLRTRAAANHRSLQGELMAILTETVDPASRAAEPDPPVYLANAAKKKVPAHGRKLSLQELWERSRKLGPKSQSESAKSVRQLRDERHRR